MDSETPVSFAVAIIIVMALWGPVLVVLGPTIMMLSPLFRREEVVVLVGAMVFLLGIAGVILLVLSWPAYVALAIIGTTISIMWDLRERRFIPPQFEPCP